ncbi:MAG: beta-ketoacyl synthase N-terminal-like domain-containing protein [Exilibacterium sp.]
MAFLQYTSGSTTEAKGVMVTHANLLQNCKSICQGFKLTPSDRLVFWLPMFHDMGLIGCIISTLYSGMEAIAMSPAAFIQRPSRWLKAMSHYRCTITIAPNFGYDISARRVNIHSLENIDLSHCRVAGCGSEVVRAETLHKFACTFASLGFKSESFFPCYGLAEATLYVCGNHLVQSHNSGAVVKVNAQALSEGHFIEEISNSNESSAGRASSQKTPSQKPLPLVSCGITSDHHRIEIVDPDTRCQKQKGEVGEIWFQGPSVTKGYWRKAKLSQKVFRAQISDDPKAGYFLRTGDLGCIYQGQLFVTGRLKEIILIDGRNYYPHDIEQTVVKISDQIRAGLCVAFSAEEQRQERLIVALELLNDENLTTLCERVRQIIALEHGLSLYQLLVLPKRSITKTSSGKIQRKLLQKAYLENRLQPQFSYCFEPHTTAPSNGVNAPDQSSPLETLTQLLARRVGICATEIDIHAPIASLGLSSREMVEITAHCEQLFSMQLPPTLLYDHPSLAKVAAFIQRPDNPGNNSIANGEGCIQRQPMSVTTPSEPIAIIGMSCRFAGCEDLDAYWDLLCKGREAISERPLSRWGEHGTVLNMPNSAKWGGWLDAVPAIDHNFFNISAREAQSMAPHQKLLMELAWVALENSNILPGGLRGSATGVYVGLSQGNGDLNQSNPNNNSNNTLNINHFWGTGSAMSIAANRISYFFDLHGPSLVVDTACSSSLVAVDLAMKSLRGNEIDLALVGAANLLLDPITSAIFAKAGMLSESGHCHTFDAAADGYVRSEGAGWVVLEKLSRARAGDRKILAVIEGSAINQDGQSNGLTAPNGTAQQRVIKNALRQAGCSGRKVDYVETHGTGTALGDPIELNALQQSYGKRPGNKPLLIGSVKTQLGHLESASGIAGLIKVILSLYHRHIPPHLHFKTPNPAASFKGLQVVDRPQPWPNSKHRRRAAISSFGFGGTNAHLILAQPPAGQGDQLKAQACNENPTDPGRQWLLPLAAKSASSLLALMKKYHHLLERGHDVYGDALELNDLCYTASCAREHMKWRICVQGENRDTLKTALSSEIEQRACGDKSEHQIHPPPQPAKVVFLFTGQGSQYPAMAINLYHRYPAFKSAVDACVRLFAPKLDVPIDQLLLTPGAESDALLRQTQYAQPAVFIFEYAMAKLWQALGISPCALLGHSLGEYAGACISGVLSLESAAHLIVRRSRLMQDMENGAMVSLTLSPERVLETFQDQKLALDIAAYNGPTQTVVSGDRNEMERLIHYCQTHSVNHHIVNDSYSFHSALMNPLIESLIQAGKEAPAQAARIPLISNLNGDFYSQEQAPAADYWANHARCAVKFQQGLETLINYFDDNLIFIEVGPEPQLNALGKQITHRRINGDFRWFPSAAKNRDNQAVFTRTLADMYREGFSIQWQNLDYQHGKFIALPGYCFEHPQEYPSMAGNAGNIEPSLAVDSVNNQSPLAHSGQNALQPRAQTAGEREKMLDYYEVLTERGEMEDDFSRSDVLHFGPFEQVQAGFSWVLAFCYPNEQTDFIAKVKQSHKALRKALFHSIDFSQVANILDIGCGHGADLISLLLDHPHCRAHGYNISPQQIELAGQRIAAKGLQDKISLFLGDSAKDDFPQHYDVIYSFQVIHHIEDKEGVFANISRHLNPGGQLILAEILSNTLSTIDEPESSAHFAPKQDWAAQLAQFGLRINECVDMSYEVANFLHLENPQADFTRIQQHFDESVYKHLLGPHRLGELLRKSLTVYGLFYISKDPYASTKHILDHNLRMLNTLTPYRQLAARLTEGASYHKPQEPALPVHSAFQHMPEALTLKLERLNRDQRIAEIENFIVKQCAAILGGKPQAIDKSKCLLHLGFDSLMLLELKNAMECELQLSLPNTLLQHQPDIGDLTRQLEAYWRQHAKASSTETALTVNAIPQPNDLTPAQCRFFQHHYQGAENWNLANPLLFLWPRVKPEHLEQAIYTVVSRHKALRLRFDLNRQQSLVDINSAYRFQQQDLAALSPQQQSQTLNETVAQIHSYAKNLKDYPLLRVVLFDKGTDSPQLLLVAVHHLLMDAFSFGIFIHEVKFICEHLARGIESPRLPRIDCDYFAVTQRYGELASSAELQKQMQYWAHPERKTAKSIPVDFENGSNAWDNCRHHFWQAGKVRTAELQQFAVDQGFSVEEIIIAALAKTCMHWSEYPGLLIDRVGHGRLGAEAHLDMSRIIGWFNTVYPVWIKLTEQQQSSPLNRRQLKTIKAQLQEVPMSGVGYGILRYLGSQENQTTLQSLPQAQICCNYLGKLDNLWAVTAKGKPTDENRAQLSIGMSEHDVIAFHRHPGTQRHYLINLVARIFDDQLEVDWSYSSQIHKADTIENLNNHFINALFHPI